MKCQGLEMVFDAHQTFQIKVSLGASNGGGVGLEKIKTSQCNILRNTILDKNLGLSSHASIFIQWGSIPRVKVLVGLQTSMQNFKAIRARKNRVEV